jgi:hypothetical protein
MEFKMNQEDLNLKIINTIERVSFLRGLVITKFIDIEGYIEAIVKIYFVLPDKHVRFGDMVFSDPYFSFGVKRNVLLKILSQISLDTYKEFKEDLHKADKLRNRFAHSVMFGFDGHLTYQHSNKPTMEIKKVEEMYNEFMILWSRLYQELSRIFDYLVNNKKRRQLTSS